jgi:hypothetical protein
MTKSKSFISLDISTSCTGYAFWEDYGEGDGLTLIETGAIETPTDKFPDINDKMDYVVKQLEAKINCTQLEYPVGSVVAEAAMKKFSGGKTTADTMAKLIAFNFCLCYTLSRSQSCKIEHIDVRAARRTCGITIPKGTKDKKEIKKIVIEHWKKEYPSLAWDLKKTGNYKDYVGDMADAITIGRAYIKNSQ